MVEQTQTWYAADGNTIATADYQRLPNDTTDTGALTATDSYVTCTATFYDQAGRDIEDVNYGRQDLIDGSSSTVFFSYPSGNPILTNGVPSVPRAQPPGSGSPNYIVTQTAYIDTSPAGPIVQTTNNAGIVTQTQSDLMGRTISTIQNYKTGSPSASYSDRDVATTDIYDPQGRLSAELTFNTVGGPGAPEAQETTYLYQSPLDPSLQTDVIDSDSTTPPLGYQAVSSLTWSDSVATATVANGYDYAVGQWVLIGGASPSGYDGCRVRAWIETSVSCAALSDN